MKQLTVFTYKIRHEAELKELREVFFKKLKKMSRHIDFVDRTQSPEIISLSRSDRFAILADYYERVKLELQINETVDNIQL